MSIGDDKGSDFPELEPIPVEVDGVTWLRQPVRTHVLTADDDIKEVVDRYTQPFRQDGDWIFISEKAVSVTQGRAVPVDQIQVGFWAGFLSKFVTRESYAPGRQRPETMQMSIEEVGLSRILLAAAASAAGKAVGRKGDFYRVAGRRVAGIDGPAPGALPPMDRCVSLVPRNPDGVSRKIRSRTGCETAIIDASNIACEILGASAGIDRKLLVKLLNDNPLGQGREQTPIGLVRRR